MAWDVSDGVTLALHQSADRVPVLPNNLMTPELGKCLSHEFATLSKFVENGTAISFDVCQAVPRSQREGSLALGATRWQTIWSVVLPYARPGIIAASFLALGRALGETMAVTMLIGNQAVIELSPFALGDTIASRIANQLNEADEPEFRAALIALALVLLVVTAGFNILARFLLTQLTGGPKARSPIRTVKSLV